MPTFTTTAPIVYPDHPGRQSPQLVRRTWGGGFRAADQGKPNQTYATIRVTIRDASRTEWNGILTFFRTTTQRSAVRFDWTDPNGTAYTGLRYLSGLEEARSRPKDRWDAELVFAIDPGA